VDRIGSDRIESRGDMRVWMACMNWIPGRNDECVYVSAVYLCGFAYAPNRRVEIAFSIFKLT
jgi:hypothetical protein